METFVLWPRLANPSAVLALGQRVFDRADIEHDALGLRCHNAGTNASLGVDLWILFTRLIKGGWLEVLDYSLVCLGDGRETDQDDEGWNCGLHVVLSNSFVTAQVGRGLDTGGDGSSPGAVVGFLKTVDEPPPPHPM